jgi:hypothetical protein
MCNASALVTMTSVQTRQSLLSENFVPGRSTYQMPLNLIFLQGVR